MTFPIFIEQTGGLFSATLLGEHEVSASGATQQEAINALARELRQRMERGELAMIELPGRSVLDLAGKYADDPTLTEIREEIYRERDRERDRAATE